MSSDRVNVTAASDSSSGPKVPPGFETEVLPNKAEWCKKVEDDNAFLHRQMAAMQSSMDLLLSIMAQQTVEEPYMPRREDGPWIVDRTTTYVPHVSHSQSPYQQWQGSLTGGIPSLQGPFQAGPDVIPNQQTQGASWQLVPFQNPPAYGMHQAHYSSGTQQVVRPEYNAQYGVPPPSNPPKTTPH